MILVFAIIDNNIIPYYSIISIATCTAVMLLIWVALKDRPSYDYAVCRFHIRIIADRDNINVRKQLLFYYLPLLIASGTCACALQSIYMDERVL